MSSPGLDVVVFMQRLRPDGQPGTVWIQRSRETGAKARALVAAGCRLNIEQLRNGTISMTVEHGDEVIGYRLCENGSPIKVAVDALVAEAYDRVVGVRA